MMSVGAVTVQMNEPLTPALCPSDGERESRRPLVLLSHPGSDAVALTAILPLPLGGGEGRGEGEPFAR